jgi:hypothetical protein
LAFIEARLETEFRDLLDLLVVGVDAHLSNRPRTVADIARAVLGYRGQDTATSAGVAMLWGALVRLASLFVRLRMGGERKVSTPERKCIGGPEQKSLSQASKKAPDIGGLLAFGGLVLDIGVGCRVGSRPA